MKKGVKIGASANRKAGHPFCGFKKNRKKAHKGYDKTCVGPTCINVEKSVA